MVFSKSSDSAFSFNMSVYHTIFLFLITLLLYSLPYGRIFNSHTTPLRALKGPSFAHWYYGSFDRQALKESKGTQQMDKWRQEFGGVYHAVQHGRLPFVVIQDRKAMAHVFLTKSRTFVKPATSLRVLSTFFGESLLGVDGPRHAVHRKVAFPSFTQTAINDLTPLFVQSGEALVARWNRLIDKTPELASEGAPINAFNEFTHAALDIIGKAGFGYDFDSLSDKESDLSKAFEKIFSLLITGSLYALLRHNFALVQWLGSYLSSEQKELDRARKVVDRVALELVTKAKAEAVEEAQLGDGKVKKDSFASKDLLSLLVRSNLSSDLKASERISDHEIVSFVPTFLAAGHETSSTALSWCAYAFTSSEKGMESQSRLRQELKSNPTWNQSAKDIESLPYLSAVTKEVLRLHCPVRATSRSATEDDLIPLDHPITLKDGSTTSAIRVQRGDIIVLPIHALNTEDRTWGDGMTFRPERFIEDEEHEFFEGGLIDEAKNLKNGWSGLQTFTVGPRNCIGMRMAILEFQAVIASVVSNFEFLPPKERVQVEYRQAVVSRPIVVGQEHLGFQLPVRIRKI